MADPKIVRLLRQMTKRERERFLRFSKIFLKKEEIHLLLGYFLIACNKQQDLNEVAIDAILGLKNGLPAAAKARAYNKLNDCLLLFLAAEQLKNKEFELLEPILLLYRLRDSQESSLLEKTIERGKRLLEKQPPNGLLSFRLRHWFMDEAYFHPIMDENGAETEYLEDMDVYFCFEILRFACKAKTAKRLKENSLDTPLLREAMALSRQAKMDAFPLIKLYRLYLELHKVFVESTYSSFKNLALTELNKLATKEQTFVFNLLINQILHAIRLDSVFLADIQMVYTLGIREKYLLDDNWLIKEHFINFINSTCALGDVKMAENFMANTDKLHPNYRADIKLVCLSRIKIAKHEYKEAFALLNGKNFRDDHLRLIGRANRLRACYDWEMNGGDMLLKGEEIIIHDQLNAFKAMLDFLKKSLGAQNERIVANYNFHEMVGELLKRNNDLTPQKWQGPLLVKLHSFKVIACRLWLSEKINDLGTRE